MNTPWYLLGCFWELFQTIPKWFAFFTYLIWIKIFTVVLQLKLLSLKAMNVSEKDLCPNRDMVLDIWYHVLGRYNFFAKTSFRDINFDVDLFSQIAKSRFLAWIYFHNWKNLFLKTLFLREKEKNIKDSSCGFI